ncbi:PREDICTED: yrdC domain-containing protein, mitochondrial [Ceratosolen solmsi marchali]|uniref:Threonylcarbamoyl-AMP synthase n=1 Tax=Ceratosolen solmsi marchali TaxID=326594 RepID=A0AAJ7DZ88_9HYME|nr:PREDICTED: yrdC domain-containing protein, mitochondrial [Ceratosolen solmsi marchali]
MGPIKERLNKAKKTIKHFPNQIHWMGGGYNSAAVAARLILDEKIIALPTDTIYGLAGLAQSNTAIHNLYDIKKRDLNKPLAICLGDVKDIITWAEVEHLPTGLIETLLPGPTTIILKRKEALNPLLNEGVRNVGIRIPKLNFFLSVMKMVNKPVALTSANITQENNTLHPTEFEHLWSKLDGIFYDRPQPSKSKKMNRDASTVVDLSVQGKFNIFRQGKNCHKTINILKRFNLSEQKEETEESVETKKSETS